MTATSPPNVYCNVEQSNPPSTGHLRFRAACRDIVSRHRCPPTARSLREGAISLAVAKHSRSTPTKARTGTRCVAVQDDEFYADQVSCARAVA